MSLLKKIGDFAGSTLNQVTGGSLGDYLPGVGDARAQDKANEINIAQAELNRKFQERMSNTAYQRAMDDMKKAGLNPILAYNQGGASVPTGSTATAAAASKTGLTGAALQAYTGISSARAQAQQVQSQTELNETSKVLTAANTAKAVNEAQLIREKTEQTRLNNVRNKKYEGADSTLGRLANKASSATNKVIDAFESSAKQREERDRQWKAHDSLWGTKTKLYK